MNCTSPKYIHSQGIYAPCGRCINCKVHKANMWATRCLHEAAQHRWSIFITLTYATGSLPLDESVHKEHWQLFAKRLRQNLHRKRINTKLKYLACGHYGDQNGRPHYHAILYGLDPMLHKLGPPPAGSRRGHEVLSGPLAEAWQLGIIHMGNVTYQSARYVAQYLLHGEPAGTKRNPPFLLMSKGMGKDWIDQNRHVITSDVGITINGKHVSIPRYYLTKVREWEGIEPLELRNARLAEILEERDQLVLNHEATTQEDYETILKEQGRNNLQKQKNTEATNRNAKLRRNSL